MDSQFRVLYSKEQEASFGETLLLGRSNFKAVPFSDFESYYKP